MVFLFLCFGGVAWFWLRTPQTHWDWTKIDTDNLFSPASSAYQVEGYNTNSQWYLWEHAKDPAGTPRIKNGDTCGIACDEWNRYPEDIRLMEALGMNAYRFLVEWSKIEPQERIFDRVAVQHSRDFCDSLWAHHIVPVVTLHHVTNPIWFEKKGAFEKEENIEDFVRFVQYIVTALGERARIYCSINEPAIYAMESYFSGTFPPGQQNPQLTAVVLRKLLIAHVKSYQAIKQLPGGDCGYRKKYRAG